MQRLALSGESSGLGFKVFSSRMTGLPQTSDFRVVDHRVSTNEIDP